MAIKQPRLCAGIVVTGSCTISILVGATPYTVTITPGTYWLDPICSGIVAAGTLDALGIFTNLLDTADTGGTYTCAYSAPFNDGEINSFASSITRSAATFSIRGSNAATNAAGRRFLRFLGFDALADATAAITLTSKIAPAIWDPLRGEDKSPEEDPSGYGVVVQTENGTAYGADIGDPLYRRLVSFPGLKMSSVKRNNSAILTSAQWANFESVMWPWLSNVNPVRYWADKNATQNTYLAAAMTAADITFTTPVVSAYANDTMICVDGEWMEVHSGFGTTTTTVYRDKPVAHGKYAPVSTDFVGTYLMDNSGGNVNQGGFKPERRSESDPRFDMTIALIRTTGV